MEITRTAADGHFQLKLKGRLDAIWSDHVSRALAECVQAGEHALALDMAEVDYISSAGIRVLVTCTKQLKAIQGRLGIVNASENVRNVLQMAGLGFLLQAAAAPGAAKPAPAEPASRRFALGPDGATAEAFDLEAAGCLRCQWPGDPVDWLSGCEPPAECAVVEFPLQALGLGLGALGGAQASAAPRLGEFLAAGGAAVCQPADGTHKPDYMLLQGALTPTVQVAYGLVARGKFQRLVRFDKGPRQTSVPLSAVLEACLETVGSPAVGLAMVAETAALVGAALQRTPEPSGPGPTRGLFAFPEVRQWLSFTAEAALANTTSLVVGVACRGEHKRPMLKPLIPSGAITGHFHAAAFPYRPLRKGRIELAATVAMLFESEQVLGLLHLLNDWRPANGAGESRFLRGACWCAPIEL